MQAQDAAREMLDSVCASDQPLFATSLDGEVLLWNLAATRLLGVPSTGLVGRPCWEAIGGLEPAGRGRCSRECPVLASARRRRTPGPVDAVLARRRLRVSHLALSDRSGRGVLVHMLDASAEPRPAPEPSARLTPREREVLDLLGAGCTSRELATRLGITHATARTHVQRVLNKVGARTRAQAVVRALAGDG